MAGIYSIRWGVKCGVADMTMREQGEDRPDQVMIGGKLGCASGKRNSEHDLPSWRVKGPPSGDGSITLDSEECWRLCCEDEYVEGHRSG